MAKHSTEWRVRPHGALARLAENLWWVQGSVPNMSLKRTMTIARLEDGRLVIHNGIALDPHAMRELEAWGTPAYLLVPNGYHRLDAPAYKTRYPELRVLAPRGSQQKVREALAVDGTYEDFPTREDVRLRTLEGVGGLEGVMLVNSSDGVSVVLNDVVFNMDRKRDLLGFLFTTLMGSAPGPRISRLAKFALVKDRAALKRDLASLSQLPDLRRLIVAHENIAHDAQARQALELALTYL
jgi:hypothetical protein